MTVLGIEKRVNSFIDNLNKELSINASANIQWLHEGNKTCIKVEVKIGEEVVLFDAGFINGKTHRYNKGRLNLRAKDDSRAFAAFYQAFSDALGIKHLVCFKGVAYELLQDPYIFDDGTYHALARKCSTDDLDEFGYDREYTVVWKTTRFWNTHPDWHSDESEACDWDNPIDVHEI